MITGFAWQFFWNNLKKWPAGAVAAWRAQIKIKRAPSRARPTSGFRRKNWQRLLHRHVLLSRHVRLNRHVHHAWTTAEVLLRSASVPRQLQTVNVVVHVLAAYVAASVSVSEWKSVRSELGLRRYCLGRTPSLCRLCRLQNIAKALARPCVVFTVGKPFPTLSLAKLNTRTGAPTVWPGDSGRLELDRGAVAKNWLRACDKPDWIRSNAGVQTHRPSRFLEMCTRCLSRQTTVAMSRLVRRERIPRDRQRIRRRRNIPLTKRSLAGRSAQCHLWLRCRRRKRRRKPRPTSWSASLPAPALRPCVAGNEILPLPAKAQSRRRGCGSSALAKTLSKWWRAERFLAYEVRKGLRWKLLWHPTWTH